jgi:hypothetical protein
MCQYIKDDGEQCGIDNHDGPFCHQHEDSRFAALWERADGAESGSSAVEMDGTCSECEASLRRRERLTDHENLGGQMMFVAYVECDCSEHVLGTQPVRISNLPDGWHDGQ